MPHGVDTQRVPIKNYPADANNRVSMHTIWHLTQDWTGGKAARIADETEFFTTLMRDFYQEINDYLVDDIGCQQLINASNWKTANDVALNDQERYAYNNLDVQAVNKYYSSEHNGPNRGWLVSPGDTYANESVLFHPEKVPTNINNPWVNP